MNYALRLLSWFTLPVVCVVALPVVIYRSLQSKDRFWVAFCDNYRGVIDWCLEWSVDLW